MKLEYFNGVEFKPETRRWMFWLARLFGKRTAKNIYFWRGKLWVTGPVVDSKSERGGANE